MRVLITGAGGFIGRCLVEDRLRRGDEVVALDIHDGAWPAGVAGRVADIGDADAVAEATTGVDLVFHLAAAHLDQSTPESEYRRVNIEAARGLVRAAAKAGVGRIVHCSSVGVYGDVTHPPVAEDGPTRPGNVYEATKLEGERAALEEAAKQGVQVVVVRPAWVYGPTCPRTQRLFRMVRKGRFFYFGSGRHLRHPIHIDDTLDGFHLAAERGRPGSAYNIAGPRQMPLRTMMDAVAGALGVKPPRLRIPYAVGWCAALLAEGLFRPFGKQPPLSRRSLVFFANTNAYSIAAAQRDLGFRPRIEIEEGMRRVVSDLAGTPGIPAAAGVRT